MGAQTLARTIAALLEPGSASVAIIVELLKWPTTAHPSVTGVLLDALYQRVPGAPGQEAGLDATVAWVVAPTRHRPRPRQPTRAARVQAAERRDPTMVEQIFGLVK